MTLTALLIREGGMFLWFIFYLFFMVYIYLLFIKNAWKRMVLTRDLHTWNEHLYVYFEKLFCISLKEDMFRKQNSPKSQDLQFLIFSCFHLGCLTLKELERWGNRYWTLSDALYSNDYYLNRPKYIIYLSYL